MEWLFGRRKTPDEMLKANKRLLDRSIRDLDRERTKMEAQEKKLINDIKKAAKDGQMESVKIMAKDLVRTRKFVKKFILMRANIQAVSLKVQTLRSQNQMGEAMKGVTRALRLMNRQMNLPQIQRIMAEFEKQSDIMEMKEDMMNEVMDDVIGDEEDESEEEQIVNQVLDELGISLDQQLKDLPIGENGMRTGKQAEKQAVADDVSDDLQARLDNLRRT